MKKLILSLVAIATIALNSFGQAPEGFKYQAVIRDAGTILNNQSVGIRMTVQQGSIGGTEVYQETFATTTNGYGLVNLEIGTGTTSGDFASINWSSGLYFIETAVDITGGTSYVVMGTSQLISVPYALHAKTAGNGLTPEQATAITNNSAKTGITTAQSSEIAVNTLKTVITPAQATAITDNSAKTGITTEQADIIAATSNTNTGDQDITGIATNADLIAALEARIAALEPPKVGDLREGGIVFWIDPTDNTKGLVAALVNQGTVFDWGCDGTEISGATETAVGTGAQNTIAIEAGCGTVGTPADICANLSLNGFDDWFLPSKDALNLMYVNIGPGAISGLGNVGAFGNYFYWSSSEIDAATAWSQYFSSGSQYESSKEDDTNHVRAVRAF